MKSLKGIITLSALAARHVEYPNYRRTIEPFFSFTRANAWLKAFAKGDCSIFLGQFVFQWNQEQKQLLRKSN